MLILTLFYDAEDAAEGEAGIFMISNGDSFYAHLNYGVIVASRLSHIAEVENVGFFDLQFF